MMETFTQYWQKIHWDSVSLCIDSQTAQDVERALTVENPGLSEIIALLSPAAMPYLEPLAQRAQQLTRRRFGNTINFYLPLYLSNLCANDCTYCGFSMSNRIRRKTLDEQEIIRECEAIRAKSINNLLLVTGEHKTKVGIDYFRRYVPLIRHYFSSLMMEVQPMSQQEYAELKGLGLDGVFVYQETYHMPTYSHHHLRGQKKDFFWRLETPDRLARAGIDKIGLGVLIGLSDNWRTDCYMVACHLLYLRNTYWKSRYSLSFPRLRPCAGGVVVPASIMDEAQLLQVMCAFRLLVPEVEISLSTRESSHFRDHAVPIVVNNVSAGSKTQPGGYANDRLELEQFLPHDNRSPQEVAQILSLAGLQPIWKDWDPHLGRYSAGGGGSERTFGDHTKSQTGNVIEP
ncbi:2-iminoacetate synthase ThiH [Candidatus Williamhamiltonella defendens]|uniref:2-iminoacetate synthase ThiH n=1 Tax=Candidatus Williamhamiltonella defendens TaxID=138072 RepID=UPI00165129FE|nr:2-iminoacetate synthase ThiH [Candidatus Hamiltonella defensa]